MFLFGKNDKSFEVELLMLRIALLKALTELEEARPNVSEEMFRFAKDSLIAAFKLEKAKLVACDEEKVQCAEELYDETQEKIDYLFEKAGFALFDGEFEGENVVVIGRWGENPENVKGPWNKKIETPDNDEVIRIPDESEFLPMEDEDAENK